MKHQFLKTAHAGCMDTPLDSIQSVEVALQWGVDIIELDVRFDSQGRGVLSHDTVDQQKEAELCTVEEVFQLIAPYQEVRVNLDMKEIEGIETLGELAKKYQMAERCFLTGIEKSRVEQIDKLKHPFPYLINYGMEISHLATEEEIQQLSNEIKGLGGFGANLHYRVVSKSLVEKFHENDQVVYVWTVDQQEWGEKMIVFEVDSITSNRLELLGGKTEC